MTSSSDLRRALGIERLENTAREEDFLDEGRSVSIRAWRDVLWNSMRHNPETRHHLTSLWRNRSPRETVWFVCGILDGRPSSSSSSFQSNSSVGPTESKAAAGGGYMWRSSLSWWQFPSLGTCQPDGGVMQAAGRHTRTTSFLLRLVGHVLLQMQNNDFFKGISPTQLREKGYWSVRYYHPWLKIEPGNNECFNEDVPAHH